MALVQDCYSTARIGVLEVCPGSYRAAAVCLDIPCFAHCGTGFWHHGHTLLKSVIHHWREPGDMHGLFRAVPGLYKVHGRALKRALLPSNG